MANNNGIHKTFKTPAALHESLLLQNSQEMSFSFGLRFMVLGKSLSSHGFLMPSPSAHFRITRTTFPLVV